MVLFQEVVKEDVPSSERALPRKNDKKALAEEEKQKEAKKGREGK